MCCTQALIRPDTENKTSIVALDRTNELAPKSDSGNESSSLDSEDGKTFIDELSKKSERGLFRMSEIDRQLIRGTFLTDPYKQSLPVQLLSENSP